MPPTETPDNPEPTESSGTAATGETEEQSDARHLDGNAAGGMLGAIFPFEMTMAVATCAGCGTTNVVGAVMAYMHGMGTILRCPTCDTPLIRIAHLRNRYYLDLRGIQLLQIAEDTASAPA